MRQELLSGRHPYTHLFPLAALFLVVALTGCERPAMQQASTAAERPSAPAPRALPDVAGEAPAPPAPQPSIAHSRDALTDTVITGKIKAAILTDPGMVGSDVSVNTDRGVVMLAGVVRNPEQTAIASAHAQRQDGVMRVDNHLSVPLS